MPLNVWGAKKDNLAGNPSVVSDVFTGFTGAGPGPIQGDVFVTGLLGAQQGLSVQGASRLQGGLVVTNTAVIDSLTAPTITAKNYVVTAELNANRMNVLGDAAIGGVLYGPSGTVYPS